ncbi:MAG: type II toxin-antitoxin system YafQ family toxin [Oscillospiraceae bacterium]|nr:type II toxin-antitoxin system YafQ family toxin [Oscillospiraceae bacterium]
MNVRWRKQFKKDYKRMMKQGKNIAELDWVILELAVPNPLPEKYCDHTLIGNYAGYRECHLNPDWLLIYDYETIKIDDKQEEQLLLVRTGSHSELLEK